MNDTTVPGGYYIGVDGQPHDANGKPLAVRAPAAPAVDLPGTVVAPPATEEKPDQLVRPASKRRKAKP